MGVCNYCKWKIQWGPRVLGCFRLLLRAHERGSLERKKERLLQRALLGGETSLWTAVGK